MQQGRHVLVGEVDVGQSQGVGSGGGELREHDAKDARRVCCEEQRHQSACRQTAFEQCLHKRHRIPDVLLAAAGVHMQLLRSLRDEVGRNVLVVDEREQLVGRGDRVCRVCRRMYRGESQLCAAANRRRVDGESRHLLDEKKRQKQKQKQRQRQRHRWRNKRNGGGEIRDMALAG